MQVTLTHLLGTQVFPVLAQITANYRKLPRKPFRSDRPDEPDRKNGMLWGVMGLDGIIWDKVGYGRNGEGAAWAVVPRDSYCTFSIFTQ